MINKVIVCLLLMLFFSATVEAARPANVQALRYSNDGEKVRIVLDVTKKVDFTESYLENPSRLIVDIEDSVLSSSVQKEYLVGSPLANRIRIGQFQPTKVRVVVESMSEINIFWLDGGTSGYRLVIDVIQVPSVFKDEKPKPQTTTTKPSANDAKTKAEKERQAKLDAERKAKEEKERKAKEEADRKAQAEKERKAKVEAERKAHEEKERKAKEERDRKAKEEKERRAKEQEKDTKTTKPTNTPKSEVDDDLDSLMTLKGKIIAIDPGHGGNDAGAIGPTGVMEKTVTLNVALELEKLLKAQGATVIMTRHTDKTVSPKGAKASAIEELQARCDVANSAKADIFISIHADSFTNASARGTTGYYYSQTEGQALCEQIKTPSRGTKPCNFYVVKNTDMAATLIELAFISNPDEENILSSKEGVLKCAQGIFDGIEDYFG